MKRIFAQFSALIAGLFLISTFMGCPSTPESNIENETTENKVTSYMSVEPSNLNPFNTNDGNGRMVLRMLCQPLVQVDEFNYEMVPLLAKERPVITVLDNDKVTMDFELRPNAKWDNGTPIMAEDVAFSLKAVIAPKVDNGHMKPYFEFIEDIIIDEENPRKFTFLCKEPYMVMESALTDLFIIPSYVYDAEGVLKNYTVKQLAAKTPSLEKDEKLLKFAENFNSSKYQRQVIAGSGPYKLKKWETGQRVTLELKENWYGKEVNDNHWFDANIGEIVFEVIADPTTAVVALKAGKVETMYRIDPRIFSQELKKDEGFTSKFDTHTPTQFLYTYYGMNTKHPKLSDVRTRKALRALMDVDAYAESIFYGMAQPVRTFLHPSKKDFINPELEFHKQDYAKAGKLLAEAGWKDSNGNGILDKMIDGELTELTIEMAYPNGPKPTEKGVLMFKEFCRKAGVEILPRPTEFAVMNQNNKAHNFEMFVGIWLSPPIESDPKQIWHTDSYNGGSNYVGFGNAESDKIIDDLRKELDRTKRSEYYKRLQKIIDDEAPYIFIVATQNRIAIHNRFANVKPNGMNPGFFVPAFSATNVVSD